MTLNGKKKKKKSYCVRRAFGAGCCGGGLKTGN